MAHLATSRRLIALDYNLTIKSFVVRCVVVLVAHAPIILHGGCLIAVLALKHELARGPTILLRDMWLCLCRLLQAVLIWRCGLVTLAGIALHALSAEGSATTSTLASELRFSVIILNAH